MVGYGAPSLGELDEEVNRGISVNNNLILRRDFHPYSIFKNGLGEWRWGERKQSTGQKDVHTSSGESQRNLRNC